MNDNYITKKDPHYFGIPLNDYSERIQKIIDKARREIERALEEQTNPNCLLRSSLFLLAQERQQLALDQNTPKTFKFGERRDSVSALTRGECHFYTNLTSVYSEYGEKLLKILQRQTGRGQEERFLSDTLETFFTWELLSYEELDERGFLQPSREALTQAFRELHHESYPIDEKPLRLQKFADLLEKNKFCSFLGSPMKERKIFLGALWRNKDGARELLSQYYSRVLLDEWEAPMIFHMDYFQIEPMLEEIEGLFLQSIREKDSLDQSIPKLRYLLSHTMPFSRGSASIQQWLISAIYQLHEMEAIYSENKEIDLEAFTTFSFEEFVKNFH